MDRFRADKEAKRKARKEREERKNSATNGTDPTSQLKDFRVKSTESDQNNNIERKESTVSEGWTTVSKPVKKGAPPPEQIVKASAELIAKKEKHFKIDIKSGIFTNGIKGELGTKSEIKGKLSTKDKIAGLTSGEPLVVPSDAVAKDKSLNSKPPMMPDSPGVKKWILYCIQTINSQWFFKPVIKLASESKRILLKGIILDDHWF